MENPYYKNFRSQPWIQKIAEKRKWTICDNTKMPIDMFVLQYRHAICGANSEKPWSLLTLDEVHKIVPDQANFDFYMQGVLDGIVVLDIEPDCPEQIKQNLLKLPALYCEESMSGKGIHMVFPYPHKIAAKIPNIQSKVVLKPKHKWYEILLYHYVTFTGREIKHTPTKSIDHFNKLFKGLAIQKIKHDQNRHNIEISIEDIQELEPKGCPVLNDILYYIKNEASHRSKTPADYGNDLSTYEYYHMAYLDHKLESILKISYIDDGIKATKPLSLAERAWCVYTAGSKFLPYRDKHEVYKKYNDIRVPWLLYLSLKAIENNENQRLAGLKGETNE